MAEPKKSESEKDEQSQRDEAKQTESTREESKRDERKRDDEKPAQRSKRKKDKAKRDKRAKAAKRAAAESETEIHAWTDGIPLSPVWWAPVFTTLMIVGLLWIVVFYISNAAFPIPQFGQWNLAVGGGIAFIGFLMTMRWR